MQKERKEHLESFVSSLKKSIWDRETVCIGGGIFDHREMLQLNESIKKLMNNDDHQQAQQESMDLAHVLLPQEKERLNAFIANLKNSSWGQEQVKIGGGVFNYTEISEIILAIQEYMEQPKTKNQQKYPFDLIPVSQLTKDDAYRLQQHLEQKYDAVFACHDWTHYDVLKYENEHCGGYTLDHDLFLALDQFFSNSPDDELIKNIYVSLPKLQHEIQDVQLAQKNAHRIKKTTRPY